MLINRKDFERILEVMDRFNMKKDWDGVRVKYQHRDGGYDLAIEFSTLIHDMVCGISVTIEKDMFGEEDDE